MKRRMMLMAVLAALALVAAACGGDDEATATSPAPTATPTTAPTLAPGETPQPTATATPVPDIDFSGKTIQLISAFAPGGGHDYYMRMLGKHMPQYLNGEPRMFITNRPGAGGIIASNYVYNETDPDDLVIFDANGGQITETILGNEAVEFDYGAYRSLGVVTGGWQACHVWGEKGITSLQDLIDSPEPIVFGTSPTTVVAVKILKEYFGANIQEVRGFSGSTAEAVVSLEQGEIDGWCTLFQGMSGARPDWLRDGTIRTIIQFATGDVGDALIEKFGLGYEVESISERRDEVNDLQWSVIAASVVGNSIEYNHVMHPDIDEATLAAIREAWWNTVNDPDFIADIEATNRPVNPQPPEAVEARVDEALAAGGDAIVELQRLINE